VHFVEGTPGKTNAGGLSSPARAIFANWSLDPRLSKFVTIGERCKLEVLIEAFNVFNHFNIPAVMNTQYQLAGNQLFPQQEFGNPTSREWEATILLRARRISTGSHRPTGTQDQLLAGATGLRAL